MIVARHIVMNTVDISEESEKILAVREDQEDISLGRKTVEKKRKKTWMTRLGGRNAMKYSDIGDGVTENSEMGDGVRKNQEEEEHLVRKMNKKFEVEHAQNSAKHHKTYLRKPWRRDECAPMCVESAAAEMRTIQRPLRDLHHFQSKFTFKGNFTANN